MPTAETQFQLRTTASCLVEQGVTKRNRELKSVPAEDYRVLSGKTISYAPPQRATAPCWQLEPNSTRSRFHVSKQPDPTKG